MSAVRTNCSFKFPTQTLQISNIVVLKGKEAVSRLMLNLKAQAWGTVGAKQDTIELTKELGSWGRSLQISGLIRTQCCHGVFSHHATEGSAGEGQKAPVGPSLAGCSHHVHLKPHGLHSGTVL